MRINMSTTTQSTVKIKIEQQIEAMEQAKRALQELISQTAEKIKIDYLKEKIKGINTELRIMYNIRTSLDKTIRQASKNTSG